MGRSIDAEMAAAGMIQPKVKTKKVLLVLPERYMDELRDIGAAELWRAFAGGTPDEAALAALRNEVKISPLIREAIAGFIARKRIEQGRAQNKQAMEAAQAALHEYEQDPHWEQWNRPLATEDAVTQSVLDNLQESCQDRDRQ